jgi:pyridoxamine 5'-phosphate oxidase
MNKNLNLRDIRLDYQKGALDERSVDGDPVAQFNVWLREALDAEVPEPTAMTLATAGNDGRPSARIVLLKDIDVNGFTFYTHYESRKGRQISKNPRVALTFFWKELERQVRIEGIAAKVSPEESDAYFHSRPYESRLSAAASPQSRPVKDRQYLENLKMQLRERHSDERLPRPDSWGGYRVKPVMIEFWQGRQSRMHDRIVYQLQENGEWKIERLAP